MEVPEWLLVILACFSSILIICFAVISIQLVKHWWRVKKYQKIRQPSQKKVKAGLKSSFFASCDHSFPPIGQPTTIQSGTPLILPTFKMHSVPNSVGSQGSSYQGKFNHGTFERKRIPFGSAHYHSMDEKIFRRAMQKPAYERQIDSPPIMPNWGNYDRMSIGSGTVSPTSVSNGYAVYTSENTPARSEHGTAVGIPDVYSHSDLLPPGSEIIESEPVVSYDQELSPSEQLSDEPAASLYFTLVYNSFTPELVITVKQATDLPSVTGNIDGVNSYVNLCLVPEDFLWKRTRVVENESNPSFNETFHIRDVLYHKLREYTICFYLMDVQPVVGERVIGKVLYPLSDLRAEHVLNICKELSSP